MTKKKWPKWLDMSLTLDRVENIVEKEYNSTIFSSGVSPGSLKSCMFVADDKYKVIQATKFFLDRVENIVDKRRKCWIPASCPFS